MSLYVPDSSSNAPMAGSTLWSIVERTPTDRRQSGHIESSQSVRRMQIHCCDPSAIRRRFCLQ